MAKNIKKILTVFSSQIFINNKKNTTPHDLSPSSMSAIFFLFFSANYSFIYGLLIKCEATILFSKKSLTDNIGRMLSLVSWWVPKLLICIWQTLIFIVFSMIIQKSIDVCIHIYIYISGWPKKTTRFLYVYKFASHWYFQQIFYAHQSL